MAEIFYYEALNSEGVKLSDTISAGNEAEARAALLAKGLAVVKIGHGEVSLRQKWTSLIHRSVRPKELILFTKQFRALFNAGIPLLDVLRILQNQAENPLLRTVLGDIYQRILEGTSLTKAFSSHPKVFPPMYLAMLAAGESSGSMPAVLDRLTYILKHEEALREKIASSMRYPKIVVFVMVVAFLILLNFVIPTFAKLYSSAKVELPLPTQIAIAMNQAITNYWWIVLPALVVMVVLLRMWLKTEKGALFRDALVLRMPIVGPVVQKAMLARFAAIFSILQRSLKVV